MYSVQEITRSLPVNRETARRWRRRRRVPAVPALALRACLEGDLGAISEAWEGWKIYQGVLYSPEGIAWTCGELNAWQFERQELSELRRERHAPMQLALMRS